MTAGELGKQRLRITMMLAQRRLCGRSFVMGRQDERKDGFSPPG